MALLGLGGISGKDEALVIQPAGRAGVHSEHGRAPKHAIPLRARGDTKRVFSASIMPPLTFHFLRQQGAAHEAVGFSQPSMNVHKEREHKDVAGQGG
eukprot:1149754-Pelagomonas_calceolata.AAC.2